MLKTNIGVMVVLFGVVPVFADNAASRLQLMGKWELTGETGKDAKRVVIEEGKGDDVHVVTLQGDQKVADYVCNTIGRDCEIRESGQKVILTQYYNGAKLVQIKTKGSDLTKQRLETVDQGDTLELEVIPLVPSGKPTVMHFHRVKQ